MPEQRLNNWHAVVVCQAASHVQCLMMRCTVSLLAHSEHSRCSTGETTAVQGRKVPAACRAHTLRTWDVAVGSRPVGVTVADALLAHTMEAAGLASAGVCMTG
jgi:hypothetical protein